VRTGGAAPCDALETFCFLPVHVGLGPGIASESITFVPGPRTNGSWLCEQGDMLVAKVVRTRNLLLTSFNRERKRSRSRSSGSTPRATNSPALSQGSDRLSPPAKARLVRRDLAPGVAGPRTCRFASAYPQSG